MMLLLGKTARQKPLTAGVYGGVGVLLAFGAGEVAALGAATVSATAGTGLAPIAAGTHAFSSTIAPIALGGLYAGDVYGRTTKWGSDYSPQAAYRFGGILSTEVLPMFAGGMLYGAARQRFQTPEVNTAPATPIKTTTIGFERSGGYTSLGIRTTEGAVESFNPLVTKSPSTGGVKGFVESFKIGEMPSIDYATVRASNPERLVPQSAFERNIAVDIVGAESGKITGGITSRVNSQYAGLAPGEMKPIFSDVAEAHGLKNPNLVADVIIKDIIASKGRGYGSAVSAEVGKEIGTKTCWRRFAGSKTD